jgi:glycosyltransferase involved in cell wall biosynthesis
MIIRTTHPMISCICITGDKTEQLTRSIHCFASQNYPNRELIISYPENDLATLNLIRQSAEKQKLVLVPVARQRNEQLSEAINNSLNYCSGEYICFWSDSGWSQSSRLSHQINNLKSDGKFCQASILNGILLYNEVLKMACLSDLSIWEETLLCRKGFLLKTPYDSDSERPSLIKYLENNKLLYQIEEFQYLYIHVYDQKSEIDPNGFLDMVAKGDLLDQESTLWVQGLLALPEKIYLFK